MSIVISRPIEILVVEDSPGDAKLISKVLSSAKIPNHLQIVGDGVEAISFLHQEGQYYQMPRPDLILLDLNLPKKNGLGVLAEIRADSQLHHIPVIILTTSDYEEDIINSYELQANCYLTKPKSLLEFQETIALIEDFWLQFAQLPLI
jgi:CheY-like chemotaxis protein